MKGFPDIRRRRHKTLVLGAVLAALSLTHAACFIDEPYEPYYGRNVVPQTQSFRWIDGGLPQTFDPAFAAAPPDTDLVRAIFEGLTDYDPRKLTPLPGVASRWESSDDGRIWTFYLRPEARWSNGESVTAKDFVDSWQRTVRIGDLAPHTDLLSNIVGAKSISGTPRKSTVTTNGSKPQRKSEPATPLEEERLGAEAIGERVLRVRLRRPDMNFPALVAHPVFRPVKLREEESLQRMGPTGLVSNGAFLLSNNNSSRVVLERAENYWGKSDVTLQTVEFVGAKNAESALAAYRAGEVDAVTNSAFEPLGLKLLAPYKDFRRQTYGALTYYSFNTSRPPFDDVRVREALAVAIDRDRLSQDEMGGATEPAKRFLPEVMSGSEKPVVTKSELLDKDDKRARELLAEAGYPEGKGFPKIRLLINRNDQQRQVAQAIASMWRAFLNIETEIVIKTWDEYEAAILAGEYDVVRRGLVMQTADEFTNIRMMFRHELQSAEAAFAVPSPSSSPGSRSAVETVERRPILTPTIESEAVALNELRSIPVYFASSYALVKPYVLGFDSNVLDAPSLKQVRIDTNWAEQKSGSANTSR